MTEIHWHVLDTWGIVEGREVWSHDVCGAFCLWLMTDRSWKGYGSRCNRSRARKRSFFMSLVRY